MAKIRPPFQLAAIALAFLVACFGSFGTLGISNVKVDVIGSQDQNQAYVTLPFSQFREEGKALFTVSAQINYSVVSSALLRIGPHDCIESIEVNGADLPLVKKEARSSRCSPSYYNIDLSQYLRLGVNTLKLHLTTNGQLYGVDLTGVYSYSAIISMVLCLGLLLYALLFKVIGDSAVPQGLRHALAGRMQRICFLPFMGVFSIFAMLVNSQGTSGTFTWRDDPGLPALAALTVAFALLLRVLDKHPDGPLPLQFSWLPLMLSVAGFLWSSWMVATVGWSTWESILVGDCGIIAGFVVVIPIRTAIRRIRDNLRPLVITILAASCPQMVYSLRMHLWEITSELTGAMVRAITWLGGYKTSIFHHQQLDKAGKEVDFYLTVVSSDFSINIGSWCSGLEGVSLLLFLLSLSVLLDWRLFSRMKHLWAVYLLTVPMVLFVNAIRIAILFLYAELYARSEGRNAAIIAIMGGFHSNIGWVMYSIVYVIFLPLVYFWAKRAVRIS